MTEKQKAALERHNKVRADRALAALETYLKMVYTFPKRRPDREDINDLVVDLLHLATRMGSNTDELLACAKEHLRSELDPDDIEMAMIEDELRELEGK